ncbi:hypothetical protein [Paenibacillus xylanexedens]|uniref:hypothetical protein n=1 Tax=Paenibacillus xylanexedens TaxID=528191 RepID=UPI003CFC04B4
MHRLSLENSGLIVSAHFDTLPALNSFYIDFEDGETINVEDGYATKQKRLFRVHHKDVDNMISSVGESNFFSLHRVFLSYYEAHSKLGHLWSHQVTKEVVQKGEHINISDIENVLETKDVQIADSRALKYANHIMNKGKEHYVEANSFQEYLWAIQMTELLRTYNLSAFEKVTINNKGIFNSSYLFKGAIVKKEISVVLYEWANLYSYTQSDFIKRLSNILETINMDITRNKSLYDKKSIRPEVNHLVYSLDKQIHSNSHYKGCFFGMFNASDLFGPYSRHSSHQIKSINGINTQENVSCKDIVTDWRKNGIFPTDQQFTKLFKLWYFTTSYLLINWLRLPHLNK